MYREVFANVTMTPGEVRHVEAVLDPPAAMSATDIIDYVTSTAALGNISEHADVTLERGATQDRDLFDWFQDVAITSSGLGLTDVNYKRNLDIVQQDRDGTTLRRWSLSRAWPVKFVAGDWDNESDENVIESVTLTYDFFELIQ